MNEANEQSESTRSVDANGAAVRSIDLLGALRLISRLCKEWNCNKLGSAHIQRRRWKRLEAIADVALQSAPNTKLTDHQIKE